MAAIPAFQELTRAARSAEKLFDTLQRELPPTLDAIRSTGVEISDLKEGISDGVEKTTRVLGQVDDSLTGVRRQVTQTTVTTRSIWAGVNATVRSLLHPQKIRPQRKRKLPPR